jgi:uncharacterized SAM-binding protein YcdF (DUF218 family)
MQSGGHPRCRDTQTPLRSPPPIGSARPALARLVEGVRLAHALPAAELWVSGPGANPTLPTHASVLRSAATALGLPQDRVVELTTGRDTEGEALAVRVRWPRAEPIALVTSAWHMPRAVALFRKAGLAVVPCPADYASRWNDDLRLGDYLAWDLSGLERSTKAIYEFLGLTWSKVTVASDRTGCRSRRC